MPGTLLFPLILAVGGPQPAAPAPGPGPGPLVTLEPGALPWHDEGRPRSALRLARDPATGRTRILVRELDTGLSYPAEIGARAILTTDGARPLDAARLRVRVVRTLLASTARPLALVESLDAAEDGLALAMRLGPTHTIIPDLYLEHRAYGGTSSFDDPLLTSQWYVRKLGLQAAWAIEDGDPSVTIMVNDNGCDLTHPDLASKFDPGADVLDDDGDPTFFPASPGNEHGTACAGLIGAQGNNGQGIVGACPECRMRCVRMLAPPPGLVPVSDDVEAFQFGLDQGASVSSNSWGFATAMTAPAPLRRAITAFIENARGGKGGFVVFAAGNDNRSLLPGELTSIAGVITVAAVNNFDEPTSFTNFGADIDLAAPTGSYTTDVLGDEGHGPGDYSSSFGGTSSACPLVAGILGLLVSAAPELTADEIMAVLRMSLKPAPFATPGPDGHDLEHGYGLVDPAAALRVLLPEPPDAGVVDTGEAPDSGEVADAGVAEPLDASAAQADAEGTAPIIEESGCGCTTGSVTSGAPGLVLLVAVGLSWLRRRRR